MQSFHGYNEQVGRFHTLSRLAILRECKQRGFSQHVTTTEAQAPALWSDVILRAIVELRGLFDSMQERLDDTGREDFHHLFEGADRLEVMLAQPETRDSTHDLMNVLAAIRGYAEMLLEDLGPAHQPLADTRLLQPDTAHWLFIVCDYIPL